MHRHAAGIRHPASVVVVVASLLLGIGCSSGGGDANLGPGDTGSIALALSSSGGSGPQGGSVVFDAMVSRSGTFSGNVSFSVTGAPTGVSAAVSNVSTSGTTTTAVVTISIAASAAPGASTLTVHASGSGVTERTASYGLTVTASSSGSFSLALSPASLSVARGASGSVQVQITRSSFSGSVALSATGAPAGVTPTFNPTSATGTLSTLSLSVGASVAAQQYSITIHGQASGMSGQTVTLTLTVTATAGGGGFSLSASGSPVSMLQGGSGQATIMITRTGGFTGSVALSMEGVPAGLTATLNPSSTTGGTATLSLLASAGLAANTYVLTVRGTAPGLSDQTTSVSVAVAAAGGSGNVTLDFSGCSSDNKAKWVAWQDGSGGWMQVAGAGDVYHFTVSSATGGYAYVTEPQFSSTTNVQVRFASRAELSAAPIVFCPPGPTKVVNGTIANAGASQIANISLGGTAVMAFGLLPNFSLVGVLDGSHDLVAYLYGGTPSAADRILIRRDQDVANNGSLGTLDFGGTEAFAPGTATITLNGVLAGEGMASSTAYLTGATCDVATLYQQFPLTTSYTIYGVPAARQRASDFHSVIATAANSTSNHSVEQVFHTLADQTLTLGAPIANPVVTAVNVGYKRLIATFGLSAEYDAGATLYYLPATGVPRPVTITASSAYLGGANATLAMPDFTGVAGWDNTWAAGAGVATNYTLSAAGRNVTGSFCQEGARIVTAVVTGSN